MNKEIIKEENIKQFLTDVLYDYFDFIFEDIENKKLTLKQQLKGLGLSRRLFNTMLLVVGKERFKDMMMGYVVNETLNRLRKGETIVVEYYYDRQHKAEIKKHKDKYIVMVSLK